MNTKKNITRPLIIYAVLFYIIWAVYTLLISPSIKDAVTDPWLRNSISALIKAVVWTVPAFILIHKHNDDLYIKAPDMFRNKFRIEWIMLPVLLGVYASISSELTIHAVWPDCIKYIMAGFAEELLFRGLFLNAIVKGDTLQEQAPAIAVTSVMFAMIHYPIWLRDGIFAQNIITGTIFISLLGAVFAVSFLKSRNIVLVMAAHAVYDLMFIFHKVQ